MNDICGWPTNDDTACEHPPTEENGRCWQHTDDARKGGRPSKFDDERAQQAIQAAREAKSLRGCARAAAIHVDTLGNWIQENPVFQNCDGDYVQFFDAFMRARARGESVLVRGGLTRDEVDASHARFLLSTSFGYAEEQRIQIEEISSVEDRDSLNEVRDLVASAYGDDFDLDES